MLRSLAGFLCALFALAAHAASHDLVLARGGALPIILTAPHGGTATVGLVKEREAGIKSRDGLTLEVAEGLEKRLAQRLGAAPYIVAARFHRKYIDANRASYEAYEDPAARAAYDAYHQHIREYLAEIRTRFPNGALLLDIHGQGSDPDVLFRGTNDGRTVWRLTQKHGSVALTGKDSVLGALASRGYSINPPNTPPGRPPEDRRYSGGYTVQQYGSHAPGGIDAIQLELGVNQRRNAAFVDDLADAVVAFYRAYLK